MADALDLKSGACNGHVGSSPTGATKGKVDMKVHIVKVTDMLSGCSESFAGAKLPDGAAIQRAYDDFRSKLNEDIKKFYRSANFMQIKMLNPVCIEQGFPILYEDQKVGEHEFYVRVSTYEVIQ